MKTLDGKRVNKWTKRIVKEARKGRVVVFQPDDSSDSYQTIREVSKMISECGGMLIRRVGVAVELVTPALAERNAHAGYYIVICDDSTSEVEQPKNWEKAAVV